MFENVVAHDKHAYDEDEVMNKQNDVMAEAEHMKYEFLNILRVKRVEDLMKRMTLEEKIGQMVQIEQNTCRRPGLSMLTTWVINAVAGQSSGMDLAGNDLTTGTTILQAIKKRVDPATQVVYSENPDSEFIKSNKFSYAIVVVGEPPYAEAFGDSLNLTIPEPRPSTIAKVCGAVVIIFGRLVMIQPYIVTIDALVAALIPGTEGQGVSDVLFHYYGITGKLAFTWFKTVDQLPVNVGDPHYDPLFPFGFDPEDRYYELHLNDL
ncbi:Glycoside hydrolase family 3 C-terminal domain [Macleaya cordata]|uniref:beta-glucosidase n=1 Tax=Macleaya cordata TaxID=56857 RepID=A0A200PRP7_MACCD|nr:Glycoside hydrolase family 3 C-terminal domain [Macleaya cordata]